VLQRIHILFIGQ